MKLIAFDIEACNRYVQGSIFSIGVVEADINFKIIDKYEILINPETKFATKFRKPINFDIDINHLKSMPNFKESFSRLNKLFSQDAIYVAHATSNDVRMLIAACKRNKLPSFKFNFICSQTLFSIFANLEQGIGLDKAGELLSHEFMHHKADEDALVSLKLVKYICNQKGMTINELLIDYGIELGILENNNVKLMKSSLLDKQRNVRRKIRLKEKKEKEREEILGKFKNLESN